MCVKHVRYSVPPESIKLCAMGLCFSSSGSRTPAGEATVATEEGHFADDRRLLNCTFIIYDAI